MSAADKRIAKLLDRWLASVDLHSGYLDLADAAYAKVQDWPQHQRPTRWIVDLARERLNELRRQLADRQAKGDQGFAESLEIVSFLTTLLGSERVDRFIPQANAATRESVETGPVPPVDVPRAAVDPPVTRPRPVKAAAADSKAAKAEKPPRPDKAAATVIADAARLLSWGREWPQLAGLITRLADRPAEQEVWSILRTHRAAIEARARRVPD
jgi:hypothetical protein